MSIQLYVYKSIFQYVYMPIRLLCIYSSIHQYIYASINLYIYASINLYIYANIFFLTNLHYRHCTAQDVFLRPLLEDPQRTLVF